jgi:hypothetical protein
VPQREAKIINPDFPEGLRALIRDCIPDLDAAEFLLVFVRHPEESFDLDALAAKVAAQQTSSAVARKYLCQFESCGLVEREEERYRLASLDAQRRKCLEALARLYNERPVTLVRAIYGLRDERIRALADAFRIRND